MAIKAESKPQAHIMIRNAKEVFIPFKHYQPNGNMWVKITKFEGMKIINAAYERTIPDIEVFVSNQSEKVFIRPCDAF